MVEPQAGTIAFGESDCGGVLGHGLVEALALFAGGLDEFEDDGFLGHGWPLPKALAAIAAASFGGSPAWAAAAMAAALPSPGPRIPSATISASRQAPQKATALRWPGLPAATVPTMPSILRRAMDSEMAARASLGGGGGGFGFAISSSHCGASAKGRGRSSHASGCHTMIEPPSARVSTPSAIRPAELRRPSTCRKNRCKPPDRVVCWRVSGK